MHSSPAGCGNNDDGGGESDTSDGNGSGAASGDVRGIAIGSGVGSGAGVAELQQLAAQHALGHSSDASGKLWHAIANAANTSQLQPLPGLVHVSLSVQSTSGGGGGGGGDASLPSQQPGSQHATGHATCASGKAAQAELTLANTSQLQLLPGLLKVSESTQLCGTGAATAVQKQAMYTSGSVERSYALKYS